MNRQNADWLAGRLLTECLSSSVQTDRTLNGDCPDRGNRQGWSWQALSNGQTGNVIAVKKGGREHEAGEKSRQLVLVLDRIAQETPKMPSQILSQLTRPTSRKKGVAAG